MTTRDLQYPEPLRSVVARALRGARAAWPDGPFEDAIPSLLEATRRQGVQPLIRYHLNATGDWETWPEGVRRAIDGQAFRDSLVAELRRAEVERVLDALAGREVPALVLKGVALAHTAYPMPGLRPVSDTDVLVPERCVEAAREVLGALGYASRKAFTYEEAFFRVDRAGLKHAIDCHWGISDVESFSREFTFEELYERSVAVPALGANGRGLSAVDALLLACFHISTHGAWDRLIWIYDVHLLLERLGDEEMARFLEEARAKRCAAVCAKAVRLAREHFGTRLAPEHLAGVERLDTLRARLVEESAWYTGEDRPVLHRALARLHGVAGWRERLGYARRLVVPDAAQMRLRYGDVSPLALPALHVHRWYRCLVDYVLKR